MICNIVFHCLGRAIRCLCPNFWILARWRSLQFWHLWAVIKLAWVKENRHAYKRSLKEPGEKGVEIALNENYPRGHYDWVTSFNPPCWSCNGRHLSTPRIIRIFFNSYRGDVQALPTLLSSFSILWSVRTWPSHAPRSSSQIWSFIVTISIKVQ
jgi:hypothetical protein